MIINIYINIAEHFKFVIKIVYKLFFLKHILVLRCLQFLKSFFVTIISK